MTATDEPKPSLFSLPNVLTTIGVLLFALFLVGHFVVSRQPEMADLGANLSFLGLNYFLFPLIGGITLKFSEVKPAPVLAPPPPGVEQYRATQGTEIQKQVLADISKRAYFKSAHMADALKRIGLSKRDEELPTLAGYRETAIDEHYALVLRFDSPMVPVQRWQDRAAKLSTFFGKGVAAHADYLPNNQVDLYLVSKSV